MHRAADRRAANRYQNQGTYFLRNRPELDLIYDIVSNKPKEKNINILILGCSFGMEVYSVKWRLRSLSNQINITGLELSEEALSIAKKGIYPLKKFDWQFGRLSGQELNDNFTIRNNIAYISPELKQDVQWVQDNACDPDLVKRIGTYDIVLANRFLCHMFPVESASCLINIKKLIASGGYLFISGVDLKVRQKVMNSPEFTLVRDRLKDIHNGDFSLHVGWPLEYWGLEPIPENYEDYLNKFAMVYKRNKM